jgi:hypothetical protein
VKKYVSEDKLETSYQRVMKEVILTLNCTQFFPLPLPEPLIIVTLLNTYATGSQVTPPCYHLHLGGSFVILSIIPFRQTD